MAQRKRGKQQTSSGRRGFYVAVAVAVVLGAGALAWALWGRGSAATELVEFEGPMDPQALVQRAEGIQLGDPTAPVRVIEFADYQCPGCGLFATQIKPLLEQNYIETGQVHFTYYDFPLVNAHQNAFLAARAARCAGDQGRYWEYHDRLYGRQSSWSNSRNPVSDFIEYAEDLGLERRAFASCLRSDRFADVVSANFRLGQELGVNSTPSVFVGSRRVQNPSWSNLREVLEQELGGRGGDS